MTDLEHYIRSFSSDEDALLSELERETYRRAVHPQMLSGHIQGKFLQLLTRSIHPRNVLEIGTFTGYSALSIAAGLDACAHIDTIEVNDELEAMAKSFFERSSHGSKIRPHIGSALDIIPRLGTLYDMVFIDGGKNEYPDYYRLLMGDSGFVPSVHSSSVILADNILWYGKVVGESATHVGDASTQGILEFNRMVKEDGRVESVILPVRDGLNYIVVK